MKLDIILLCMRVVFSAFALWIVLVVYDSNRDIYRQFEKARAWTIAQFCLVAGLIFLCTRCHSGIVATGPNRYMISRSNGAGMFANMPATKAKVIAEANRFAASKGQVAECIDAKETFPTHGFPSYEYHFRLVAGTNEPALPPLRDENVQRNVQLSPKER